jgi:hypothetical protein
MIKKSRHTNFKTALRLKGQSIKSWAESLPKPDGGEGVSHTAVIRVSQGHESIEWIEEAIEKLIQDSKRTYPEYWEKQIRKQPIKN